MADLREEYRWLIKALEDKSGENIVLMDLTGQGALADVFILVTANSEVHMKTLLEAAEQAAHTRGLNCLLEGESSANWRLLDAGDVIVHVFSQKGRDFYKLERLWTEAKILEDA